MRELFELELNSHSPGLLFCLEVSKGDKSSFAFLSRSRPRPGAEPITGRSDPKREAARRVSSPPTNSLVETVLEVVTQVKVPRVPAWSIVASMQDLGVDRNRTYVKFKRKSMRLDELPCDRKMSIPTLVGRCEPRPTGVRIIWNRVFGKEILNWGSVYSWCHRKLLPLAGPLRVDPRAAFFKGVA